MLYYQVSILSLGLASLSPILLSATFRQGKDYLTCWVIGKPMIDLIVGQKCIKKAGTFTDDFRTFWLGHAKLICRIAHSPPRILLVFRKKIKKIKILVACFEVP